MNYTKAQHSAPYAAISPKLPALSAAGKTILIVGASSGIAQATARAFLEAGSERLALVSRGADVLAPFVSELKEKHPKAHVATFAADAKDAAALEAVFAGASEAFGASSSIDVVVNAAGYQPDLAPVAKTDLAEWWRGFEVNVLGAATLARVIASHASSEAVVLQLGTAGAFFPAQLPSTLFCVSAPSIHVFTFTIFYISGDSDGVKLFDNYSVRLRGEQAGARQAHGVLRRREPFAPCRHGAPGHRAVYRGRTEDDEAVGFRLAWR